MARRRHEAESRTSHRSSNGDVRSREETDEPFEDWEHYPAAQAEENIGYRRSLGTGPHSAMRAWPCSCWRPW